MINCWFSRLRVRGECMVCLDFEIRGGYIGEVGSIWDNRFYICVEIIEYYVNFLVDSWFIVYFILKIVFN